MTFRLEDTNLAQYFDQISFFFKKDFANNFVCVGLTIICAFKTVLEFHSNVCIFVYYVYIDVIFISYVFLFTLNLNHH